jgi:hypothetical protein
LITPEADRVQDENKTPDFILEVLRVTTKTYISLVPKIQAALKKLFFSTLPLLKKD